MEFYSNGKLWVIGEYFVLAGAKVLAWPTKFGQYLRVFPIQSPVISWKSYDADGSLWYSDEFSLSSIQAGEATSTDKVRNTLIRILYEAHQLNPQLLSSTQGFVIETELTFSRHWGLGSSSTLINNIAQWFQVDAFLLLDRSFGGSGFDIACAQHNQAITYQKIADQIEVKEVNFYPEFKNHLYFVYLNQKKDSKEGIANFMHKKNKLTTEIVEVTAMTDRFVNGISFQEFQDTLQDYEKMLASLLETPTVQEEFFPDFEGTIKSLGAWGGDFVMVLSKEDPTTYFYSKGYTTVLPFDTLIL